MKIQSAGLPSVIMLPCLVLALAGCAEGGSTPPSPPPGAIPAGQAIGTGSITGRVILDGPSPPRQKLIVSDAACRAGHSGDVLTEAVVVNPDGTLRNVIVHITSGLGDLVFAPPGPAVIDQIGCLYTPHVSAVQVNQIVTFANSDATLHNVHAVSKINSPFNVGMATKGLRISRFFSKPEIVKIKCDVHSWMLTYTGVFENPFHEVTADGGTFELKGLPAGVYEVEAWQESLGTKSQTVTLGDGESRSIEFHFGN